ncbi:MAG: type II/IV secretion system protein [Planctomycetes bacterium]|nr:type II/IV secretion system protein [Planctomycetota bacterium]
MPSGAVAETRAPIEAVAGKIQEILRRPNFMVAEVVDTVLERAIACKASDIHVEPYKGAVRVRYRVDGVFHDVGTLPKEIHEQFVSRAKVMSNLVSHKREVSQEGRITMKLGGTASDLRVSIVPTVNGEKMVIRIFDPMRALFELEELGLGGGLRDKLVDLLFNLQGMIIVTGPSGSGKTTTLYSCLQKISTDLGKLASIITIEDPVEYDLGLFAQMQVNRMQNIDFASGLSFVLRQDPEVIMVGEIRDTETCEVALQAGLTGHLVLTTIHAGTGCEVVTRLLDMKMKPFVVASAVTGVVSQRLIRTLCADCKAEYQPPKQLVELCEKMTGRKDMQFRKGKGCAACGGTGYRGRAAIAELLVMDEEIRNKVLAIPSTSELQKFAMARGMKPLLLDGLEKAADGLTTLEEVLWVAGVSTKYLPL